MPVSKSVRIHPSSIVSPEAQLGLDVEVGPFCSIGPRVVIGDRTRIGPSCMIQGPVTIGRENVIYGHASIGTDPQDLKFGGEETWLTIGDRNTIREFTTLNRGTAGGGGRSTIGDDNLLMTGVHVAHDCHVGDRNILANAATLAGHVEIGSDSTVGAFTGVHQFCRIGDHAFIGGYSVITRDCLPFVKTVGIRNDAKIYGINSIGLERKGFSKEVVEALTHAYRILFRKKLLLRDAVAQLRTEGRGPEVTYLLDFIEQSERGFVR